LGKKARQEYRLATASRTSIVKTSTAEWPTVNVAGIR